MVACVCCVCACVCLHICVGVHMPQHVSVFVTGQGMGPRSQEADAARQTEHLEA